MKKILLYSLIFWFFKSHLSLAWGFEVKFKSEITCDLFHNDKKFATKSWPLNTDEEGGYLTWATDSILEWHENIMVSEDPLKWVVMFYHVDRYSGKGSWDSTVDLDNENLIKNFLDKNVIRRNAHLILKNDLDLNGDISCKEATKKF
tara:strand:+ start:91 stop:531 length:441 start_codon:yes stop_codon:yes gene_type:complete